MTIADFHNDILTLESFKSIPLEYAQHKIVTAIFRGQRSFKDAVSLAKYSSCLAFEDLGYSDLNLDQLINLKPV